jgi:hypothetical protein
MSPGRWNPPRVTIESRFGVSSLIPHFKMAPIRWDVGVASEGVAAHVNVSRKVESATCDDLSEEGKLADTSVLDLDVSEAVEQG